MRSIIFAAGLGTRLRPLTNNKPKALVKINETPLLEIAIQHLKHHGFNEIIINIHHFGEQIIQFLKDKNNFGIHIEISDERDLLLETGGGLKKAAAFLNKGPFLAFNADIISDIDLKAFYDAHCLSGALATVAVRERKTSRYLQFDEQLNLCGWTNVKTGEVKTARKATNLTNWAFSGIHILSPEIFDFMPAQDKFSIIDVYLKAAQTHIIKAYPHNEDLWLDVGKPEALEQAKALLN
jgi:NDP-sugar pyrophosphorylase family protein